MKRVIVPIGYVLAVLLGFALLSYPMISNYLYEQRQDGVIERYETLAQDTALDETRKKALEAARKYNRQLASGVVSLEDPFLTATTPEKDGTQSSILDITGHRCNRHAGGSGAESGAACLLRHRQRNAGAWHWGAGDLLPPGRR